MTTFFADTSCFLALLNPTDQDHARALTISRRTSDTIATTEFILVELASHLSSPRHRDLFLRALAHLRGSPFVNIVPCSSELLQRGVEMFLRRMDKEWSLIDCISFVVMEQLELDLALTAYHHFVQAGFRALLLENPS